MNSAHLLFSAVAVFVGAGLGALARWQLSIALNQTGAFPIGTLAANWIGGLLIGIIAAYLSHKPELAPQWRLFWITGMLGGLTTFSTFSSEAVQYMMQGQWLLFLTHSSLHLIGSIALAALGVWLVSIWM